MSIENEHKIKQAYLACDDRSSMGIPDLRIYCRCGWGYEDRGHFDLAIQSFADHVVAETRLTP